MWNVSCSPNVRSVAGKHFVKQASGLLKSFWGQFNGVGLSDRLEIRPRPCRRAIASQSKPLQAAPVTLRLSHNNASMV